MAFSHDGSMLIQHRQEDCCFANFVSVWKVPTCELIWEWRNTSATRFFSVAFSPKNKNIIAFGTARRVYIYNIDTDTKIKEIRDGGADFLWFTDDHLITIRDYHGPRPVKIYDITTWDLVREFEVADQISGGFKMYLSATDLSPDAQVMTLGFTPTTNTGLGEYGEAHIWNLQTDEVHCYNDSIGFVKSVDFSPDGSMVVLSTTDGDRSFHYDYLRVMDSNTCEELYSHEMPIEWTMKLNEARFLNDTQVAGILRLNTETANQLYSPIFMMDFRTGEFLENWDWLLQNSTRTVNGEALSVSPDGQYFAVGNASHSGKSSLSLWKAGHISRVSTQPTPEVPNILIYPNPVADYVKFDGLSLDATITVFDILGREILRTKESEADLSRLSPGLYLYTITSESKQASGKLVKQ